MLDILEWRVGFGRRSSRCARVVYTRRGEIVEEQVLGGRTRTHGQASRALELCCSQSMHKGATCWAR